MLESRRSRSIAKRFLDDAQKPFEAVKRQHARHAVEMNSAQELLGYMKERVGFHSAFFIKKKGAGGLAGVNKIFR